MGVLVIVAEVDTGPFSAGEVIDVIDDRQSPGGLILSDKSGRYSLLYVDATLKDPDIVDLTERRFEFALNGEKHYLERKHKIDTEGLPEEKKRPRPKSEVLNKSEVLEIRKDHTFQKGRQELRRVGR